MYPTCIRVVQGGPEPQAAILYLMVLARFFFHEFTFLGFFNSPKFWQPQHPLTMTSKGQLCKYEEIRMFIHFEPAP